MLGNAKKVLATEIMLQELIQCDKKLIPGNFYAQQRRKKHDESRLVFPENKEKFVSEKHETHYTLNFKKYKVICRPSGRPCSPTRRNNPHPSKNFLTWRIPTRVFDYGEAKKPDTTFLRSNINDTYQSFYSDYSGKSKPAQNEVDTKLLLEMTKTYSGNATRKKDRKSRIELKSNADPSYSLNLPSLLRKSWSPVQSSLGISNGAKRETLSPIFLKEELRPLFKSWYDEASSKDKDKNNRKAKTPEVIAMMEENYIHKVLEKALQPDAIEAIEDWLLEADEEEREIAMQFIQTILLASMQKQKEESMGTKANSIQKQRQKEESTGTQTNFPRSLTPLKRDIQTPHQLSKPKKDHHHTKSCDVCARKNLEAALQQLQVVAMNPHEMQGIAEFNPLLHPRWMTEKNNCIGRRLNRPQQPTLSFNPGNKTSLFVTKKPRVRHYKIHPEWF